MDKFLNFLGLTKRAGKLLEGYNKCEEEMKRSKIYLFIFSNSISNRSKDNFSKEELGYSIGRCEINILGVTDENMAEKLLSYSNNN